MAPLIDDSDRGVDYVHNIELNPTRPRFIIIGAGSRGNSYAQAVAESGLGVVAAVADVIDFKRKSLGSKYIWRQAKSVPGQEFSHWRDFLIYEEQRRKDASAGLSTAPGVDGAFICILDEQHVEAVTALAPLGLHILCEKPLATRLSDCLKIQRAIASGPKSIFAIGHVLRYSPHNMLLRHLALEQGVIGDILSLEHTEPVGWWHFSHSYVRGNWRKESVTAPSLLTKSCHDVDFVMWLLSSPSQAGIGPHLPSHISSFGALKQFQKTKKPKDAGAAVNCLSCPIKDTCMFSAPRIYYDRHLAKGHARWPVHIVKPEAEALQAEGKHEEAKAALFAALAEDYDATTPVSDIEDRPWYGRCVWESDNDVVDDQFVTIEWEDCGTPGKGAKTANIHMIAQTLAQCDRRGRIYGTQGEISYDSKTITVHDFVNGLTRTHNPEVPKNSHHGGGDYGITEQFVKAVIAVDRAEMTTEKAQREFLGCDLEEVIRSHAAVFAAEEARLGKKVIDWKEWWEMNMNSN